MKIGLTKFNYPEIRCVTTSQENDYINLKKYNIYYYFNNIPVIKNYFHRFLFKPISVKNVSVHDKFHRTLILSGFCFLKIAKISLNSSFFPKPIKR